MPYLLEKDIIMTTICYILHWYVYISAGMFCKQLTKQQSVFCCWGCWEIIRPVPSYHCPIQSFQCPYSVLSMSLSRPINVPLQSSPSPYPIPPVSHTVLLMPYTSLSACPHLFLLSSSTVLPISFFFFLVHTEHE